MRMRGTRATAVIGLLAMAALVVPVAVPGVPTPEADATPVAVNEATYQAFGRVFPDPQGCVRGLPGTSPWAKGDVCAIQLIQFDEAIAGLKFLEDRFPRYLQVINLRTQMGDHPELSDEELQSAGLPQADLGRLRSDLYVVKVTDVQSPVPEADRKHFAYALSIHGIERAGVEGGIRAVEDLVTWAACEDDPAAAPACAVEGPFPKPILEPSNSGPTAGEVLTHGVVYFTLANPDGWRRGDLTTGGAFYQRYNGNGMDLNRDWPTIGYTEAQYTSWSEPETRGFGKYLQLVAAGTTEGRFAGAIDLHGMLTAPSFSFTLLGAGQRDFRKNAISVDTATTTFRDSIDRLGWSSLIAPPDACPGDITVPGLGGNLPMCPDQWGTVWDTINYQVTGSFGDWMDSPLGLDAVGIDNEMALSHLTPNNAFSQEVEQLHIDGNKGLIYSQIASLLFEEPVEFVPGGRVAYVFDPDRISHPGGEPADPGLGDLPTQDDIDHTNLTGIQEFAFEVKGPADGFFNGGLTVEATFANVGGISPQPATADLVLEYCGPPDHPGDDEGCHEVARYFDQSPLYLQAGALIDLNAPRPGPYRIRPEPGAALPTRFHVSFSRGQAFPVPDQAPYDVSRMDFFDDLNRYVAPGSEVEAVTVDEILHRRRVLEPFDTVVVADDFMPGFVPAGPPEPPSGDPQPGFEVTMTPSPVPDPVASTGPLDVFEEFTVEDAYQNDRMVVAASWEVASDFDVTVEQLDPETGEWVGRGCECVFVGSGETVTVLGPEPGQWRIRLHNFAGVAQPVTVAVTFGADPAPPAAPPSRYTPREFRRYANRLTSFATDGGNLVLTDGALVGLPSLGTDIAPEAVQGGFFYAGWMDFNDGEGPTYDRHHLAGDVNKEGTAEGVATVDGTPFENRHQTYEPTPLGFYVSPSASANSSCTGDRCDSPNWIVDQAAWEAAGGTTAARTLVRTTVSPGSTSHLGTSLGELAVGAGRIRIAGALLPDPTEANYHPFGLSSYALTYTGYQLIENLVAWEKPPPHQVGK